MAIGALVVDDSATMRRMIIRFLKQSDLPDFDFREARDGEDALEKFDPDRTRVVFADWNMPRLSGLDLVRELRRREREPITIVMITTEATPDAREEIEAAGGVEVYVTKPFSAEDLACAVRPALKGKAA